MPGEGVDKSVDIEGGGAAGAGARPKSPAQASVELLAPNLVNRFTLESKFLRKGRKPLDLLGIVFVKRLEQKYQIRKETREAKADRAGEEQVSYPEESANEDKDEDGENQVQAKENVGNALDPAPADAHKNAEDPLDSYFAVVLGKHYAAKPDFNVILYKFRHTSNLDADLGQVEIKGIQTNQPPSKHIKPLE